MLARLRLILLPLAVCALFTVGASVGFADDAEDPATGAGVGQDGDSGDGEGDGDSEGEGDGDGDSEGEGDGDGADAEPPPPRRYVYQSQCEPSEDEAVNGEMNLLYTDFLMSQRGDLESAEYVASIEALHELAVAFVDGNCGIDGKASFEQEAEARHYACWSLNTLSKHEELTALASGWLHDEEGKLINHDDGVAARLWYWLATAHLELDHEDDCRAAIESLRPLDERYALIVEFLANHKWPADSGESTTPDEEKLASLNEAIADFGVKAESDGDEETRTDIYAFRDACRQAEDVAGLFVTLWNWYYTELGHRSAYADGSLPDFGLTEEIDGDTAVVTITVLTSSRLADLRYACIRTDEDTWLVNGRASN